MSAHPKFYLGAITILRHAEAALRSAGETAAAYLYQHAYNTPDAAIDDDEPVTNTYVLPNGDTLIVITDTTRTQTVLMTPADRET